MTIQELIYKEMDHFMGILIAKNQLSHEKVIEVSANIGAYLIRSRHVQNKTISNEEIEVVLQNIVDFISISFDNQFNTEDFLLIKETTVELLKNPSFDHEIQYYFKGFYA